MNQAAALKELREQYAKASRDKDDRRMRFIYQQMLRVKALERGSDEH